MEKLTDKDKIKHFTACLLISIIHPYLAIGASLGKEYGDKNATGNHWCWLDLIADGIGILIGSIPHYCIFEVWI